MSSNNNSFRLSHFLFISFLFCIGKVTTATCQQVVAMNREMWDSAHGVWYLASRTTYEYDDNGFQTLATEQRFDNSNFWPDGLRELRTNDTQGRPVMRDVEQHFANTGLWTPYSRKIDTYNVDGMISASIMQYTDGTQFNDTARETYNYNTDGALTSYLWEDWNPAMGSYSNHERRVFSTVSGSANPSIYPSFYSSYGPNNPDFHFESTIGNVMTEVREIWTDTEWRPADSYSFNYDAQGRISLISTNYDPSGNPDIQHDRLSKEYDSQGRIIHQRDDRLYEATGAWYMDYDYYNTYDDQGRLTEALVIDGFISGNLINYSRLTYEYETLKTQQFDSQQFSVHPNPAKNQITIRGSKIRGESYVLTDLNGRTVKAAGITEDNMSVDVSNLEAGLYLLKIGNASVKKIIKN